MTARESDSSPLPLAGEVARRAGEGNGESTLSMERHRSDCPHPSPLPQAGEGVSIPGKPDARTANSSKFIPDAASGPNGLR